MKLVAGLFLAAMMLVSAQLPAAADCQCLANGKVFEQGEIACLQLSSGAQLARCEKVLNNSSWKKIADGCPQSSVVSPGTPYDPQADAELHARKAAHEG